MSPPFRPARGSAGEFSSVLLDLAGTLTDSAPVILASFRATLTDLGIPVPDRKTLLSFVGPPLASSFRDHAGTGPITASACTKLPLTRECPTWCGP